MWVLGTTIQSFHSGKIMQTKVMLFILLTVLLTAFLPKDRLIQPHRMALAEIKGSQIIQNIDTQMDITSQMFTEAFM